MIAERYAKDIPYLVKWLVNRGRIRGERDELESLAAEALMKSIKGFDPSHGVKFITYFVRSIETRCWGYQSREVVKPTSDVQARRAKVVSLATPLASGTGTLLDMIARNRRCESGGDDGPSKAARERFWEEAVRRLPERLGRVILYRFRDGLTLEKCSERLGVTKERVRQLEKRAMNKLQDDPTLGKRLDWEAR